MTLSEWFEQNKDKEVEFVDGKIEIVNKCPFKRGDLYYFLCSSGVVIADSWNDADEDYRRWNEGLAFKTEEEGERAVEIFTETLLKFREENKRQKAKGRI